MEDTENFFGRWIATTYRCAQIYLIKEFSSYDIGSGQFQFLLVLFSKNGISQEEISEILNVDKGTTTKGLQSLERHGYVIREINEEDKRAYKVYVTEKAIALKPIIINILRQWTEILADGFSQEERDVALSLLKRLHHNAVAFIKDYK